MRIRIRHLCRAALENGWLTSDSPTFALRQQFNTLNRLTGVLGALIGTMQANIFIDKVKRENEKKDEYGDNNHRVTLTRISSDVL